MICTSCGRDGHRASHCPYRRGRVALVLVLLMPLLMGAKSGCGGGYEQSTVTDTFCLTAEKRKWSIEDRPDLIQEARVHNTLIDKRCSAKKTS